MTSKSEQYSSHPFPYFGIPVTRDVSAISQAIDAKYKIAKLHEVRVQTQYIWKDFANNVVLIAARGKRIAEYIPDLRLIEKVIDRIYPSFEAQIQIYAEPDNKLHPNVKQRILENAEKIWYLAPDVALWMFEKAITSHGIHVDASKAKLSPSKGVSSDLDSAKPLVFLSAKSDDYSHARKVFEHLKSFGIRVFFSDETLPRLGNSDYRKEIDHALDSANHMVVVTSSVEHVSSPWVEAEWGFFVQEKRSARKSGNLVTLVAGNLQPSQLPPSLRYYEVLPLTTDSLNRLLRYVESC